MDRTKKVELVPSIRKANIEPKSIDAETRTIDVVFSTGSQVTRGGFFTEPFIEELSLERKHVRLDRLNSGAPLLNNHRSNDLTDVIGVVENASVDGKAGVASVRFSERDDVEPIFKDVQSGIIRNISVGYRVHKFKEVGERDGMKVLRAVDWEPVEISAVPAGADPNAHFRADSAGLEKNVCDIILRNEIQPEEPVEPKTDDPENQIDCVDQRHDENDHSLEEKTMDVKEKKELENAGKLAERNRQKDIRDAVRKAGLGAEFAEKLINDDVEIDEARTQIIDQLAEVDAKKETAPTNPEPNVEVVRERADTVKRGIEGALMHRAGVGEAQGEAVEFKHMSLVRLAEESLNNQGFKTRGLTKSKIAAIAMNDDQTLVRKGHTTSDFPEILANVANKTMRAGYDRASRTFMPFTREVTLPDFKQVSRVQLGEGEKLELVPEKGEIKRGTISEAAEKYQLATYAKIMCFSRQMLINDDMSAFDRIASVLGERAADLESDLVWGIITGNPVMGDTINLFDTAGHGNDAAAGAAPSDTTLSAGRAAMRSQIGLDGAIINIFPQWLYVPQSLETTAEKLVASIVPDSSTNVSPFSQSGRTPLQLAVEPRLEIASATAWYLMSTAQRLDMIELARLEGQAGPAISSREGFDVSGLEIKIEMDIAAKAIDYRGFYRNVGV